MWVKQCHKPPFFLGMGIIPPIKNSDLGNGSLFYPQYNIVHDIELKSLNMVVSISVIMEISGNLTWKYHGHVNLGNIYRK